MIHCIPARVACTGCRTCLGKSNNDNRQAWLQFITTFFAIASQK